MKEKYSSPWFEITTFKSEEILSVSSAEEQHDFANFNSADFK